MQTVDHFSTYTYFLLIDVFVVPKCTIKHHLFDYSLIGVSKISFEQMEFYRISFNLDRSHFSQTLGTYWLTVCELQP